MGENNKLREASAVSVPYLMMLGWLCGGWGVLKSAVAAESQAGSADWDKTFLDSKFAFGGDLCHASFATGGANFPSDTDGWRGGRGAL